MVSKLTSSERIADSQKNLLEQVVEDRLGLYSVQLRFLDSSGKFEYQVQCPLGTITIPQLPSRGDRAELNFDIRLGGQPLHQSEILLVDPSWILAGMENVSQVLIRAGVGIVNIRAVAERLGLADKLSYSPLRLSEPDARVLGVAASACTKFRVIIFETAFKDLEKERAAALGDFLLERAKRTTQAFILFGADGVPANWSSAIGVKYQNQGSSSRVDGGALRKVRKLVASSKSGSERELLITRPQRVAKNNGRKERLANSEIISNPNHELEFSYRPQINGKVSRVKLRNSLTKVSLWDRLLYWFAYGSLARRIKGRWAAIIEDQTPIGSLMPEVKLQMIRARKRVNFLEWLLLATCVMFIVLYAIRN